MQITSGTIVRSIMLLVVIVNLILKAMGKNLIDIDEGTISYYLETIISIAVIIVGFWKNNSYSAKAIKADEFLKNLKNNTEESEEQDNG